MNGTNARKLTLLMFLAGTIVLGLGRLIVADDADQPADMGPDVVILRELENVFEPVPFNHKSHAEMGEMWYGCVTCHHRSPQPGAQMTSDSPTTTVLNKTQEGSAEIPACKTCHSVSREDADIRVPGLKGAYHRQCLNCHREWMHENACAICHKPKKPGQIQIDPTPDDIVGRMHPPIPEPDETYYKTRFTPADGGNVLFRHREHTVGYGIRCVNCHHQDKCTHCHNPSGDTSAQKPLRPGMTWDESHGPCMACHRQNRCVHCHYKDGQQPPPPFNHATTGQILDKNHEKLACAQCHRSFDFTITPTCGGTACHNDKRVVFPPDRPGPVTSSGPAPGKGNGEASRTALRPTRNEPQ